MKTWFITGVSSGFGREMAEQLLAAGAAVIGSVRRPEAVQDLKDKYPQTFDVRIFDMRDTKAVKKAVADAFSEHGKIDVIVSCAGYGLFGAAEELSDEEIDAILGTNLRGSIAFIQAAIPFLRRQKHGRIIQISSYGGQVAFPGNSLYHASKFGIEGFCESVAQELAPFGIGMTIVEPGGARTDFRYRSAHVAKLMPEYDGTPTHAFLRMLDKKAGLAPGDPKKMAARIIEFADKLNAPLRIVLGSQALAATLDTLKKRIAELEKQKDLAASTDVTD
jgi:NAD(P)-dependent dehydrogenase (short-subunit alcohol dehydrogenase family)